MKHIDTLTEAQKARMDSWANEWIGIGLKTGDADRALFEKSAEACYATAGIPWPGVVVWVPSPIVLAIATPVSALMIEMTRKRGAVDDAVDDAVGGAVGGAVRGAVDDAVGGAVDDAVCGAVDDAVHDAVHGAVRGAVRGAVDDAVRGAVHDAVGVAVRGAVRGAVDDAVRGAVHDAVGGAVGGAVRGAVGGAVRGAVHDAVGVAVHDAVGVAVRGAVDDAVDDAVCGAVDDAVRGAVHDAVGVAVHDAVHGAVHGAVRGAVRGAVGGAVGGAVHDAVGVAVRGAVRGAVDDAVRGAVRGAVHDAVGVAVHDAVGVAVRGAVDDAVDDAVGGAVDDAVCGAVDDAVCGAVDDAVRGAVHDAVDDAVRGAVRGAVHDAVRGAVHDAVGDGKNAKIIRKAVADVIANGWANYIGGQFWSGGYWWGGAYTSFFREVCSLELDGDLWARGIAYEGTIKSACWWYPHRDFVMVCERPTVINTELVNQARPRGWGSHRLHCADGPAVKWSDGWGVYSVHGVRVPRHVVMEPEKITLAEIKAEKNAEIRRVMIERYGYERYLSDAKLKLIDSRSSDDPIIGLRTARLWLDDKSGITLLDMLNSTPEPDGSVKRYVLPVDADAYSGRAGRECLAAMASTWRRASDYSLYFKSPEDYRPVAES